MPVQTLPFSTLIKIDRKSIVPIFQQLAKGLIQLIEAGRIKSGFRLPSSRELAITMRLNRTTVVAAYDELSVQGWIEVVPRKGVTISSKLPLLKPKPFRDSTNEEVSRKPDFYKKLTSEHQNRQKPSFDIVVNDGYPDARIAPLQMLSSQYKTLLDRHSRHIMLINERSTGAASLRTELSLFLSQTRGLNVTADNILTTRGAQGAIYIAAQMIVKPGSKVIVGELNYSMANKVFRQLGATLIKVSIDENGINVDEIEEICKVEKPDLLYIIPHHHHPTTVTLSAERRVKLLNIIRTYQLPVIEDDYDYDFHYENSPILPLASGDHNGLILYVGSISKTLALTVRAGYLVADADTILQASKFKELMEIRGDYLMEDSIAHLFKSGEMQRHITRSVKLYKNRRDIFCDLLNSKLYEVLQFNVPYGGMAVWALFDKKLSLPKIAAALVKHRIYLNDGSLYNQEVPDINGIRLGFASINEKEIEKFVSTLFIEAKKSSS